MTMMQPDPAAEFRQETEFRAKVYRMLSLGLSTTEIEGLLRCKVDWALFSENTLRDMVQNSSKVMVVVPPELQMTVDHIAESQKDSTQYLKKELAKSKSEILAKFLTLEKDMNYNFNVVIGSVIICSSLIAILLLTVAGVLLFK